MNIVLNENHTRKLGQSARSKQTCIGCGLGKPLGEFNKHPRTATGYTRKCRQCCGEAISAGRRGSLKLKAKRQARDRAEVEARRAGHTLVELVGRLEIAVHQAEGMAMMDDRLGEHAKGLASILSDFQRVVKT